MPFFGFSSSRGDFFLLFQMIHSFLLHISLLWYQLRHIQASHKSTHEPSLVGTSRFQPQIGNQIHFIYCCRWHNRTSRDIINDCCFEMATAVKNIKEIQFNIINCKIWISLILRCMQGIVEINPVRYKILIILSVSSNFYHNHSTSRLNLDSSKPD